MNEHTSTPNSIESNIIGDLSSSSIESADQRCQASPVVDPSSQIAGFQSSPGNSVPFPRPSPPFSPLSMNHGRVDQGEMFFEGGSSPLRPGQTSSPKRGSQEESLILTPSAKRSRVTRWNESSSDGDDLVHQLRSWREDGYFNQLWETAEFFAVRLVMLTGDQNDSYWLALIYYSSGRYRQALQELTARGLLDSPKCRVVAARCSLALGELEKAMEYVGEDDPSDIDEKNPEDLEDEIKVAALGCYVRGQIFAEIGKFDRAKSCFLLALRIDAHCFEPLNALIKHNLLAPDDIENLLEKLSEKESLFLVSSYHLKLRHSPDTEATMKEAFGIKAHWDGLLWHAKDQYAQGLVRDSYKTIKKLLKYDHANRDCLPLLINVLVELGLTRELVQLSNELKQWCSDEAISLFAEATVELIEGRPKVARTLFWDLCQKFPGFAPAWVAYGHLCVGVEGYTKATRAYATAARLIPTAHEPLLFLGRCHRDFGSISVAETYFKKADLLAPHPDPSVKNELGLLYYNKADFESAARQFRAGLECSKEHSAFSANPRSKLKESLWINLGHSLRRLDDYTASRFCFQNAIKTNPFSAPALAGLGMVAHAFDHIQVCIQHYHNSLLNDPHNHVVKSLLDAAMSGGEPLEDFPLEPFSLTPDDIPPPPKYFTNPRKHKSMDIPYSVAVGLRPEPELTIRNILSDNDTPTPSRRLDSR